MTGENYYKGHIFVHQNFMVLRGIYLGYRESERGMRLY
jgi:mannosyl-oligosaccharide glucosidase